MIITIILILISIVSYSYFFLKFGFESDLWLDKKETSSKKKWYNRIINFFALIPTALIYSHFWRFADCQDAGEAIISYIVGGLALIFFAPLLERIGLIIAKYLSKYKYFNKIREQE